MKRPLAILAITALSALVIYACGSTIPTGNSSFVTISIGGDSRTAKLHAEQATAWTRLKYFLADAKIMPEAQAYIPSVVQVLVVTVSAADITTPIVGIDSLGPDQTTSTIRIEVPNGAARVFTVEGVRKIDSTTYYRGTATADLDGTEKTLPVSMSFVGPGIWVDPSKPISANTPTCGSSQAAACATITHVLNSRPATTNNDVILALPGTYKVGSVAQQELFPLALRPGMVLLCAGVNFSSIISVSGLTAILGNDGAAVDNCMITATPGAGTISGIDDQGTRTRINGVRIELSGSPSVDVLVGASLSADSSMLESLVTGSGASLSVYGVKVLGGKPNIKSSTISNLPVGIELTATAGDAAISNSFVLGNSTVGIETVAPGRPLISKTVFDGNVTGLILGAGSPVVTGSTFMNNSNSGVEITTGSNPEISISVITKNGIGILDSRADYLSGFVHDNSIYCNNFLNLSTSITTTPDYRMNAWENAPPLVSGPAVTINGFCSQGDDICANGSAVPDYSSFKAAVPVVCSRPIAKPVN